MIILFHYLSQLLLEYFKVKKEVPQNNIRFCPPVYLQRYRKVSDTILDEKWRKKIRSMVDFGSSDLSIFTHLRRINLNHIVLVDMDEKLLREKSHRIRPLPTDYTNTRLELLTVTVLAGNVAHPDFRLKSLDAVTAVELIEHLYPDSLEAFPYNVFGFIRPKLVLVTTPNADFNVLFFGNSVNKFRHDDHKFEWTREQFEAWATNITERFPDYTVSFSGLGEDPNGSTHLGYCTQVAVFLRKDLLDENYVLSESTPCVCDKYSPCKYDPEKLKLSCNCVCSFCCPTASHGICTYHTYTKVVCWADGTPKPPSAGSYYNSVDFVQYPVKEDHRTEEEILLDELHYKINTMGRPGYWYYNDDLERSEIPLYDLVHSHKALPITQPELKKILEAEGYRVEEVQLQNSFYKCQCLVYNSHMDSSSEYSYDSDNGARYSSRANLSESDWDEEYKSDYSDMLLDESEVPAPKRLSHILKAVAAN